MTYVASDQCWRLKKEATGHGQALSSLKHPLQPVQLSAPKIIKVEWNHKLHTQGFNGGVVPGFKSLP